VHAYIIGIDLGTSSVKIEIWDNDGNLLIRREVPINKQDHEEWVKALHNAIPVNYLLDHRIRKIVSADSTSGTMLLVDKYGNPVYRPIMYYEKDPVYYEKIKDLQSVNNLMRMGVDISPTSPIVKLLRIKNEHPDIYEKSRWIIPPTTWLLYKLVIPEGHEWSDIKIDYTNALKFGADITKDKPEWYKPLFEETGISLEKFPSITECGEFIGEGSSDIAKDTGLYKAEIYQGMTDGNAAALASGALDIGDTILYSGSTTVAKYVSDKMITSSSVYYHKHPLRGFLASTATGLTGGTLSWFIDKIFGTNIDEALEEAKKIEAGKEFLFFPPGDRSPFNDPYMGAAILSIWPIINDRKTAIGIMTRSIVLGIIFLEKHLINSFEQIFNKNINEVNISGGGAKDYYWNKLRASVYGKQVKVYGGNIALGAVIPAILRSGIHTSIEYVRQKFIKPLYTITPDHDLYNKYKHKADRYIELWNKLRELYHMIEE